MPQFFITGTDTDAGKTLVTAALLNLAQKQGYRALGLKPLAAGTGPFSDQRNGDAELLQHFSQPPLAAAQHNPILLPQPWSPNLAATHAGLELSLEQLVQACHPTPATTQYDFTFIEGAGGWLVPINAEQTLADLAQALACPIILVVGLRLGCLNHALLTLQAIQACQLPVAGWVASQVDPDQEAAMENLDFLRQHPALAEQPFLGYLPHLQPASTQVSTWQQALNRVEQASAYLQLPPI